MAARYRIIREIGRGAMGRVYLAQDNLLEREVALKELSVPDYLSEEEKAEVRERFRLEAKAAAKLAHPHILTVHDIILSGGRQYIVMEYLEGKTMREVLKERLLSPEEVMSIAPMICEALGYAHQRGIIHRDVKPDNIFVLQNGNIKVADFGIAKMIRVSDRTHTDVIMGTPNYIAPEVIKGMPYDHRVDIFALGVTIYEMLTGRRPFDAENDFAIIYKVVSEEPVPLAVLRDDLPPSLDRAVGRALEKDPDRRYRSMEEFKADLMEVRSALGMAVRKEERFDKEKALRSELEAAREVHLEVEEETDRGYDFHRDKQWKELIARIYRSEEDVEVRSEETSDSSVEKGRAKWKELETEARSERASYPGVPSRGISPVVPGTEKRRATAARTASPSLAGAPSTRSLPAEIAADLSDRAKLYGGLVAISGMIVIGCTLLPWIGKVLNPARDLAGISFPEGMILSGLATIVLGCDAMLLLGVGSRSGWGKAMRVISMLCILMALLFIGLRIIGGFGYKRAAGISLGQAFLGTGWGFWLGLAGTLVFAWGSSKLSAEVS